MAFSSNEFIKLVKSAVSLGASDIHIRTNEKPCFRLRGDLISVKTEPFTYKDVRDCILLLLSDEKKKQNIDNIKELDGSYQIPKTCRLRYNFLRYQGRIGIILRIISSDTPTTEELGLPSVINRIAGVQNGLVLVTGATGSGKSSTLAAMIDHVNKTKPVHILTLEDPIEYVYTPIKARITQREIGEDTDDFNLALRSALRQDPDIILIGEMRDAETISTALKASETGHLVFGTVHTTDALNTIGRLISMFPPGEQDAVRVRIAENLYSTISQRLLKTIDGSGRVAAQEIMITSPGTKEAIADPNLTHEIYTYMVKGKKGLGTQTFDQHITDLYKDGKISLEEARANATSPDDFDRNLVFGGEVDEEFD